MLASSTRLCSATMPFSPSILSAIWRRQNRECANRQATRPSLPSAPADAADRGAWRTAPSGTVIDWNTRTIYEVVPAKQWEGPRDRPVNAVEMMSLFPAAQSYAQPHATAAQVDPRRFAFPDRPDQQHGKPYGASQARAATIKASTPILQGRMDNRRKARTVIGRDLVESACLLGFRVAVGSPPQCYPFWCPGDRLRGRGGSSEAVVCTVEGGN